MRRLKKPVEMLRALWPVGEGGGWISLSAEQEFARLHAIFGERPGLVGANDRGRPERFDRSEVADQDIAPGETLRREDERQGQRREKPFRHHRDDDPDREDEILPERHIDYRADGEERQPDADRESRDQSAQIGELPAQWRDNIIGRLGEMRDLAEFGMRAGRENNGLTLSGDDRGAGQQDVPAADRIIFLGGAGIASLRHRLASHGRIADPQGERLGQAAIRRDDFALFDEEKVARNELIGRQARHRPASQQIDPPGQQLLEGVEGLFDPIFLPEGEYPANQDHADKGITDPRHPLPGRAPFGDKGEPGGNPQDDGEKLDELAKQAQDRGRAGDLLDAVGAVLARPAASLCRG